MTLALLAGVRSSVAYFTNTQTSTDNIITAGDLDIELDKPYANGKHCKDCIDSYKYWHNQTPAERLAEQKEKEEIFGKVINV